MALSGVKTWNAGEILFASDLNAEFSNILTNGEDLSTPATKNHDMDGNELLLDSDADSSISSTSDDVVVLKAQGVDLFRFDGSATTSVNGFDFVANATGVDLVVLAQGTDTNIDMDIQSKGTGYVFANGEPLGVVAAASFTF